MTTRFDTELLIRTSIQSLRDGLLAFVYGMFGGGIPLFIVIGISSLILKRNMVEPVMAILGYPWLCIIILLLIRAGYRCFLPLGKQAYLGGLISVIIGPLLFAVAPFLYVSYTGKKILRVYEGDGWRAILKMYVFAQICVFFIFIGSIIASIAYFRSFHEKFSLNA